MFNDNRDFLKSQVTKRPAKGPNELCPQCGAGLARAPGRMLRVCPFCESILSVTHDAEIREWLIRPALSRAECFRLLSAWLWEIHRGAASNPEIVEQQWIAWRQAPARNRGNHQVWSADLCAPKQYPELRGMKLPYGEHLPYSDDTALGFDLGLRPELSGDESRNIFMPVYIARFKIGQSSERAIIEAATGKVRGTLPARRDQSLRRWTGFGIAALALLTEAFLIRNITVRLVVTGVTFIAAEVALGLIWEGLLWRK